MTNLAVALLRSSEPDAPLRGYDELLELFHSSEKPPPRWRIGGESERFGVDATSGLPLPYSGERSVLTLLAILARDFGWEALREAQGRPVIGLRRGDVSITLEPGAQIELSGAPLPDVHAVRAEMCAHLQELGAAARGLNVKWLATGFHPTARLADLPQVPKQRYGIMREYFPGRGSGGLDMMSRTATVQANFDYGGEEDALRKLRVMLRMAPLLNAITANSPFAEGRRAGFASLRGDVWLRVDPERTGLIPSLWTARRPGYRDYVEWALDAGMFLILRGDRVITNTGQSFRSFLKHGYFGYRATRADWKLHLNALFPEVRLKNTLEVRCIDALPTELATAVTALLTGLLYDERALAACEQLMGQFDYATVVSARPHLVREGLQAQLGGVAVRRLAEQVIEFAQGGLSRRARFDGAGRDEGSLLAPLRELLEQGRTPADMAMARLPPAGAIDVAELISRTEV